MLLYTEIHVQGIYKIINKPESKQQNRNRDKQYRINKKRHKFTSWRKSERKKRMMNRFTSPSTSFRFVGFGRNRFPKESTEATSC